MIRLFPLLLSAGALLSLSGTAGAQTLQGSAASLDRQNAQAAAHDFSYLRDPAQVRRFVDAGYLVPVRPSRDFDLYGVSFPYARPEVRLFVERLSAQYRAACGEKLVVTSLTRPLSHQPANASDRSVHPTGMAVDLRRSANARCRSWLERTLLSLDGAGVLEAIYERNPPHYHVALYPQPYATYVARIAGSAPAAVQVASLSAPAAETAPSEAPETFTTHTVARGESLWTIARDYGVPESRIQNENGLRSSRILAGQRLRIPGAGAPGSEAPPAAVQVASLPAPAAETTPAEAGGGFATHTVARGESLWTIARDYGVPESRIQMENGLSGSRILAGQRLRIPTADAPPATAAASVQHRVAPGESLWSIALQYGASVDEIQSLNGINRTRIFANQTLEIPVRQEP